VTVGRVPCPAIEQANITLRAAIMLALGAECPWAWLWALPSAQQSSFWLEAPSLPERRRSRKSRAAVPFRSKGSSQKEDVPKVQTEDVPKVQTEDVPKAKTQDVPKVKSENPQPVPLGSLQTASDDPASTSSIDRLNVAAGQPVCVDQDALAAAFFAAVVIGARPEQIASYGCRMIPKDAQVEILQRFPSGFQFLRLVKVNVTSSSQADATVGYTFEISR
jgi:hypothetical protein